MRRKVQTDTLVATLLVVSLFAVMLAVGAGSVAAVHPDDAQDVTEESNFTINFPYKTDHYPGDQNTENGSIEYFSAGEEAFHEMGASDGIYYHYIIVHAEYDGEEWIDYSACDTENTKAFGIDRGNNNSGTNYDEDLVTHREDSEFRDDGIVVDFYDWEDLPEDPPYMAPEDAIVAAQGAGSPGGPCLTLTDEPGWYRIAAFANATVNDNHPDEQPTEDAEKIRFQLDSTFVYVCMCDSEEEARDELGPPPNEDGGDTNDTPEPDETPTPTEATGDDDGSDDGSTDDGSTDDGGDTETTDDDGSDDDGSDDDGSDDDGSDDAAANAAEEDGDGGTPAADGPGFGPLAALIALLASALLIFRRR